MTPRRRPTLLVSIALLLVIAAIVVPAAQAKYGPDDVGIVATHQAPVRPDDRAGIRGSTLPGPAVAPTVATSSDRFDWSSAAVGAGGAAALTILAGGTALMVGRRRQDGRLAAL